MSDMRDFNLPRASCGAARVLEATSGALIASPLPRVTTFDILSTRISMDGNLQGHALPTIDVRNKPELQWWARELNVSEDQLRGLISRVGNSAGAVRGVLKASRASGEAAEPAKRRDVREGERSASRASSRALPVTLAVAVV